MAVTLDHGIFLFPWNLNYLLLPFSWVMLDVLGDASSVQTHASIYLSQRKSTG